MTLFESALIYARNKFRIFPLHPSAKAPRISNWQHDASYDVDAIGQWWAQWPDSNIAMLLEGLAVLDIDPRHGGLESIADLEKEHGVLEPRARQRSGGGGWH